MNTKLYLDHLRHTAAHLLAAAVLELYPNTKRTIGPSIENGFYYDFDFEGIKISDEDLPKIEKKMQEIVKSWNEFSHREISADAAKAEYKGNPYKIELIEEFANEGQTLTFYKAGEYEDLCRGGHVENPANELQFFKLTSIAGAYWRGSEKNPMLTRIYGTAWPTQKKLTDYLETIEEAKKRDHRKLGPSLELFMFHETAPGMPYWLPNGVILYNELIEFWRKEHSKRGYKEIFSPLFNKKELYETSGHWSHYKSNMFIFESEGDTYGLKPMNCPNAMIVFKSKSRSYRDLPFRLSDTDTLHRNELSGTLNGLFRAREFRQDDAHIFVTEDQIKDEFKNVFELVELFYSIFGLKYSFRLGTRPENFMGEIDLWNKAEESLKEILAESKQKYFIEEGDGAFYGPKIDILMKDSLGRSWQMGTIQLDFQLPRNFNLEYIDNEGNKKTPATIHRVIYGSMERFIGIITEHFAGAFPAWISPIQVQILPITDRNIEYAKKIQGKLQNENIRTDVDIRSETLQAKIRDAQLQKVPYMLILGDKEEQNQTVSVRLRTGVNEGAVSVDEVIARIVNSIKTRSLEL